MTSTTPELTQTELARAIDRVAQILQARVGGYSNAATHFDRRVLLQVAADLPPTPRFDRNAWVKAWQDSRQDGTLTSRKALYRALYVTVADALEDEDGGTWEGQHEPAALRRLASRLRSVDTKVCIDDTLGPLDARVDPTDRWNGHISPRFTLDAARALAAQTQRLAEECGPECVETVHVIDFGTADNDGRPVAVVLKISWMYLEEEGPTKGTHIIEPDDEGRYNIGGWEWCWDFASWWCACGSYQDWHVTECEGWQCGLSREKGTALAGVARKAFSILRRLAPEATEVLVEDGRVVGVLVHGDEINLGDGGPFDTETLGEADAALRDVIGDDTGGYSLPWLSYYGR
ncbi:hypothetical protein ACWFR1_11900 [Streptomyces sp. NPDC055103]